MFQSKFVRLAVAVVCFCLAGFSQASFPPLRGTVLDGVGRVIAGASVTAVASNGRRLSVSTGPQGRFSLHLPPGQYQIQVVKPSFAVYSAPLQISTTPPQALAITLDLAPMQQYLVVAATGMPTPQTQLGQSVQVLSPRALAARNGFTLDDALRELPGVQIVRNGGIGGVTDLSLRGSPAGFTKILLDGIPLQRFDFSSLDFATLVPAGLRSATLVQGGDSVLYGSDAATGVLALTSRSGADVGPPQLSLTTSAGSFATVERSAELRGDWQPLDYDFTFANLDTRNQLPRNNAWNQTGAANLGLHLPARVSARLNLRRISSRAGDPGPYEFYHVADDSWERQGETYGSLQLRQTTTAAWSNQLELYRTAVNYAFATFAPSGTPFDPYGYGANYLGAPVTITGANGYSVHGQAILDYAGAYPQYYSSDSIGTGLNTQTTYALNSHWRVAAGYRFDQERTRTAPAIRWHNQGTFAELSGALADRMFATAGVAEDFQSRFGNSFDPQASLALMPRLHRGGWWNEIRLRANAAEATKDPTVAQDSSSLYDAVVASSGAGGAASLHVLPVHPQRSHTFELGADQYLANDQLRLSASWFDDRFDDLIEFVPTSAFPLLGISPVATTAAQAFGGAYLNSLSESSKGVELDLNARLSGGWRAGLTYTYLDPVVRKSFSSDALSPAINPAFPNIPIGAYAPLVGARPFLVAPESGSITTGYDHRQWNLQFAAIISSRRDASTFLSDGYFGNTMLLPNHDLAPAYANLSISGEYALSPRFTLEGALENLLNQNFQEALGYPSLGRAAHLGLRFTL